MIFERHANLHYKYGRRNLWSTGYYVSIVGINDSTVTKYIREQENQDQTADKISLKEYETPFNGRVHGLNKVKVSVIKALAVIRPYNPCVYHPLNAWYLLITEKTIL